MGPQVWCGCHLGNILAFLLGILQITIKILPHIPVRNLVHGKNVNYIFITNFRI